jgi:hypothetical protein
MPDPITVLKGGAAALDLTAKAISGLPKIMSWIQVQPEAAAAELSAIITEIMKAPEVVNRAVDALLSVIDDEKPKLAQLGKLGDGSLLTDIELARPHCHNIEAIAGRHLWQWLDRTTGPSADELRAFLNTMRQGDGDLFYGLADVARGVEGVATEAFTLAAEQRQQEALDVLRRAAPELFALRKQANALALTLAAMQTQFRRHALGLPPEDTDQKTP